MIHRLGLRTRVFLFFAALGAGAVLALVGGLALGYRRLGDPAALSGFVQGGVIAGFAILGLVAWVWILFDMNFARAIEGLSGAIRARAHADVGGAIDYAPARYLGDLAPAASAAVMTLAQTRSALAGRVAQETTHLAAQKGWLEALLADVPVGVVLCSGAHQLVFYNGAAQDLLGAQHMGPGLDRSLFDYLRDGPIAEAHQRLIEAGDGDAASDILCASHDASCMMEGRMRLVACDDPAQGPPGYVLTLRDISADLADHDHHQQRLSGVLDRVRRPAAALRSALGQMSAGPEACADAALIRAMQAEVAHLFQVITDAGLRDAQAHSDVAAPWITRASDLADGVRARIEASGATLVVTATPLLVRANGPDIVALLADLAHRICHDTNAPIPTWAFTLRIEEEGARARVRLGWQGGAVPGAQIAAWLDQPLAGGLSDLSGGAVLAAHGATLIPDAQNDHAGLCLSLPIARRALRPPKATARRVVYDFDLLSKARAASVVDARLGDLTYVVFDTETTGLMPEQGDEIVQIAAVRILNGRRIEAEVFETLVNPGRPIPLGATAVHGITAAMIADAPPVSEAIVRFHQFAKGAVLVAHNAPFDMAFLRRREDELGLRFDHPILDTVLLSAVAFGQHQTHTLDALGHRLGVTIPQEARHTALGDAIATADVFLRLQVMLQARGLDLFGDVIAEVRRHGRLLKDANEGPNLGPRRR